MKIVDITNIEDLILTKSEIDNYYIENEINKEKMELSDYMVNIATPNMIYSDHGKTIPFKMLELGKDLKYLFISNKEDSNKLSSILEKINYDFSQLKKINIEYIVENYNGLEDIELFIINDIYYLINP